MAAKKLILGLKTAFIWCTLGIERVKVKVVLSTMYRIFSNFVESRRVREIGGKITVFD